jgi:hypothetical protein
MNDVDILKSLNVREFIQSANFRKNPNFSRNAFQNAWSESETNSLSSRSVRQLLIL